MSLEDLVTRWVTPPPDGWKCRCGEALDYPGLCGFCAERRERQQARERIMERIATIPVQFRWATFDSTELQQRCPRAPIDATRNAIEDLAEGRIRNVVLLGHAGVGKTSLACAGLRVLLEHPIGFSGRFCASVGVSASRSDSGLGSMPQALSDAIRSSVIVFDDLGQEAAKHADVVTEVFQARYNDSKPTIVTSWLEPEAIAQRYGDGTARRILEHSAVVRVG